MLIDLLYLYATLAVICKRFVRKPWLTHIPLICPFQCQTSGVQTPQLHIFSTFFFNKLFYDHMKYDYEAVRRWTSPAALKAWGQLSPCVLDCELLIVPIHKTNHWTAALIDLRNHTLHYMDSYHPEVSLASDLNSIDRTGFVRLLKLTLCRPQVSTDLAKGHSSRARLSCTIMGAIDVIICFCYA